MEELQEEEDPCLLLIVEDDEEIAEMIEGVAMGLNMVVSIETDPLKALEYLRANEVDLVITDLNMPGMNGLELVENVKGIQPRAKMIMTTGGATKDTMLAALRAGVSDFVEKPIDWMRLEVILKNMDEIVSLTKRNQRILDQIQALTST